MELRLDGVTAAYGRRPVLEDISFTVREGSLTALVGRNGAGKSTLVGCLTGEKQDYRGTMYLDGQDIRSLSRGERACRLACLPQVLPRPHVTVEELIAFGRTPYTPVTGMLSATDKDKIRWALNAVEMAGYADAFVDTLSGGERKKAFFAMVLAQDTPVVVLDEPTAHLDAVSRFGFLNLINDLRRETGKTFLTVMHELPEVLRYADTIVAIHEKRVAFEGSPAACLEAGIGETCFGVRVTGDGETGYAVSPLA